MRDGTVPGIGQSAGTNSYISFSKLDNQYMNSHFPPCYFMKLSEVCFLRAEGALRGWNMGGSAQQFYEEGIRYAFLEDRDMEDIKYKDMLEDYMNVTKAKDYTYVDPTGETPDMPSVTKIPVKWDNSLDNEKKLEMIITQKYIASYPYSYESWVDLRRTGYPRLFPVLNPEDGDGSLTMGDNAEYCSGLNIIVVCLGSLTILRPRRTSTQQVCPHSVVLISRLHASGGMLTLLTSKHRPTRRKA